MERSIIHLNIADFAVAVEGQINPAIRDYPVAIAPRGSSRASVYDMSEEAFRQGVRKHMPLEKASRICKDLQIIAPRFDRYEQAMTDVARQALPYSPFIEAGSGDGHVFIDITGTSRLFGPSPDVAWRLHKGIKKRLGLNPIWSVAANKLVAKVATRLVKPSGEYIVGEGEEKSLLKPLHIGLLPGIENNDISILKTFNFNFVFELLPLKIMHLEIPFGKRAGFIHDTIRGKDTSPVLPAKKPAALLKADHEFTPDTNHIKDLERALTRLVEKIGTELRKKRMAAARIALEISYSDGIRHKGEMKINPESANEFILYKKVKPLLHRIVKRRVRVRHIRAICSKTVFPQVQMDLFESLPETLTKKDALVRAMDKIRERFGGDAVTRGTVKLPERG